MGKSKNDKKRLSKAKRKKDKTSKAQLLAVAQMTKMANTAKDNSAKNPPDTQPSTSSDEATFPTEDNGNSHPAESFASVASKLDDQTIFEKPLSTSFHVARKLLAEDDTISDDDTVRAGLDNVRLSVMAAIPSKDVDEEEAPLEAI